VKFESQFGDVIMDISETGKIKVTSNIPFLKVNKEFDDMKEAKKEYEKAITKLKEILSEFERISEIKSSDTKLFNQLYKHFLNFSKILLYGPTGTGKTFTAIQVLKKMKEEKKIDDYLIFTFSSSMEDIDLLGKFIPQTDKTLKFSESLFLDFLKRNKNKNTAILFDEFNRASAKTLNILIPALDERDGKVIIENFINNEKIEIPAKNIKFIFTANFGGDYAGTFQIDEAILNRINIALFCDYQDDVETKILDSYRLNSDIKRFIKELTIFLREAQKQGLCRPFTTRDVKTTAKLLKHFRDLSDKKAIYEAILPVLYKISKYDNLGYPDEEFLNEVKKFIEGDE